LPPPVLPDMTVATLTTATQARLSVAADSSTVTQPAPSFTPITTGTIDYFTTETQARLSDP